MCTIVTGQVGPGPLEADYSRSVRDSLPNERKLSGSKLKRNPGQQRDQETSSNCSRLTATRGSVVEFWN